MSTHNICFYKEEDNITDFNLNPTKLLDSVLIGVCLVIRSNTVPHFSKETLKNKKKRICPHPHPLQNSFLLEWHPLRRD